jgi:hypothetical protein
MQCTHSTELFEFSSHSSARQRLASHSPATRQPLASGSPAARLGVLSIGDKHPPTSRFFINPILKVAATTSQKYSDDGTATHPHC